MVDVLLPENWLKIFSYLSKKDVCSLMSACRYLYEIGSRPVLWKNIKVNKLKLTPVCSLQFLTWPRFSKLQSFDASESELGPGSVNNLTKIICSVPDLHHLNLSHVNLSDISSVTLAFLSKHLVSIHLAQTRLSPLQLNPLMTQLSNIGKDPFTPMPDCDDVKLEDCECNCDGRLETLNLSGNNLGDVDSQILAAGISNVLRVNLGNTKLKHDQISSLFLTLSESSCRLRHLILRDVDLSPVNQDILASTSSTLSSLNLQESRLTQGQISKLLTFISQDNNRIASLNLSYNSLALITPDLPSKAALKLQTFKLNWCKLSCVQLTKILDVKNVSNKQLHLTLDGANFDGVPRNVLAKYQMSGCLNMFQRFLSSPGSL